MFDKLIEVKRRYEEINQLLMDPTVINDNKRYKDLMKIFHPDNNSGDAELVQLINKEFAKRKQDYF